MYIDSIFQDFESFLKTKIDLVEEDIRLVLNEYNSSCITYELEPGIYTFKDLFEALSNIPQPEYEIFDNSVDIEFDDIAKKTKLVEKPGDIAARFEVFSFFITMLVFQPHWNYK